MISTFHNSDQTLSKDGFVLKSKYQYKFKLFGIKFFERNSTADNVVTKNKSFDDGVASVGFNMK